MSTTKVLHVIARMNVGGTARYVGELVEAIPDSKLATGFVQGLEVEELVDSKIIRIRHLGRKISPINDFKAWQELRKVVKETNPRIVHTHTFKAGLVGRLVAGKHKRVHTFHGHLFNDNSFSFFEKIIITFVEKFLAKRTDILVSVGKKVGQELRSNGIGKTQTWVSIPPGVDKLPEFNQVEARRALMLPESGILVGWMGRMASVKNPDLLLKIANQLPNLQFVMAGGGELLERIMKVAPVNVKVIGWTDAATFWSAVDIAISTSDNEGMPIALIEAQLAGVPVVATNVGSNSEVIQNGITGYIIDENDEILIATINLLASSHSLRQSFGEKGLERAKNMFSTQKMIQNHLNIYAKFLK
jgi:glycosyltransferase involved in cell wall biosynthesis